jgi:hypothetical protein
MSKKPARAFRAPEDDDEVRATPSAPAAPISSIEPTTAPVEAAEPPASNASAGRPEHRQGRKNLSVWVNDRAHRTLKAIAAEEGVSLQDYVIDMLNREFARKGRPQIAK